MMYRILHMRNGYSIWSDKDSKYLVNIFDYKNAEKIVEILNEDAYQQKQYQNRQAGLMRKHL